MSTKVGPKDFDITIKFGGGLHTRASEDEINEREAADGHNFLLDVENKELRNRKPFDLIGAVPNGAEIRGAATLLKSDGSISTLVQAGASVYEWDGQTTFTLVGTVNANAKLRGHWRSHNWTLDDKVLITDLSLVEVVKEWDGTTFASSQFTKGASGEAFGTFYAKYLNVSDERAVFSHIRDGGSVVPHMIVGSERSNYLKISVADRPSSSLSEADPFFLLTPDLRPINGHVQAFGTSVISTEKGRLFNLNGESAKDFSFAEFYAGSAATGEEAVAYIGNDVIYGRQGRIESLRDTDRFGDSEADDITAGIADRVEGDTGWRIVYNSRLSRVYALPDEKSEAWVFQNAMRGGQVSPWMRWTTQHPMAFQPTLIMSLLDPLDGLEYVFMGDASGNFYRVEGDGAGDGGDANVSVEWLTRLFSAPLDTEFNSIEGYIKYRKNVASSVTLTFEYAGFAASNESIVIDLPGLDAEGAAHFGGDYWFGGEVYFGVAAENRLIKQKFFPPGQASDFQIRVTTDGMANIGINEIGLRLKAAST